MKVITLRKEEIYGGSLLLVNAQYSLKNQEKITLASVDSRFPDIQMESHAADILRLILTYISSGDEIVPVSGYRSSEEQTAIFEDSLKENGEAFTRQFVALPRHSEHQTGLAIDLGLNQEEIDFICPEFPLRAFVIHLEKRLLITDLSSVMGRIRKASPGYPTSHGISGTWDIPIPGL